MGSAVLPPADTLAHSSAVIRHGHRRVGLKGSQKLTGAWQPHTRPPVCREAARCGLRLPLGRARKSEIPFFEEMANAKHDPPNAAVSSVRSCSVKTSCAGLSTSSDMLLGEARWVQASSSLKHLFGAGVLLLGSWGIVGHQSKPSIQSYLCLSLSPFPFILLLRNPTGRAPPK